MSGYTYTRNDEYSLIKDGDYEVTIDRIDKKKAGEKDFISISYRIRTDVEQESQNRCVFENIWAEREHPEFINRRRINQLLGTQKDIQDGQVFETIDDIIDFLNGANLMVHISKVFDDYRQRDTNTVAYYRTTKYAPKQLGEKTEAKTPSVDDLADEDLPF